MRRLIAVIAKRRWLPAILWAIVILTVSSIPDLDITAGRFRGCDKLSHFIEYSVLGIAVRYRAGGPRVGFALGGVGFAALDELHQKLVPNRITSFWDLVADVGGLLLGFFLIGWRIGRKGKNG